MKRIMILWALIASLIIVAITFIGIDMKKKNKPYELLENDLVEYSDVYIRLKEININQEKEYIVYLNDLLKENLLESVMVDEDLCDGYVVVSKKEYKTYIKCKKYQTRGYVNRG